MVRYAIAASHGCPVWAALLGVPENSPGQKMDSQVPVPTQLHKAVPGATWVG